MAKTTSENFSIVIPTCGDRANLEHLLERIARQSYRGTIEVIIVVNTLKTTQLIRSLKKRFARKFRFIFEKKAGPSFARNAGFAVAQYRNVVFLDDDVLVGKNYLQSIAAAIQAHPKAKMLGGLINITQSLTNASPKEWLKNYPWIFVKSNFGKKARKLVHMESHLSAQLIYRRDATEKTGPFNPVLGNYLTIEPIGGEDYELGQRLLLQNFEVWHCPSIQATHQDSHQYSFVKILRRQWQAGREIYFAEQQLKKTFPEFREHTFLKILKPELVGFIKSLLSIKTAHWHSHYAFKVSFYARYLACQFGLLR